MKKTSPINASLIFAAAAALLFAAVMILPFRLAPRSTTWNAAMFLCLAAYAALLCRLSGKGLRVLFAPFLILSAVLAVAGSLAGFVVPAAAGLCWIRSGICFSGPIARRVLAETLTGGAGLLLCAVLQPPGLTGRVLGLWMFFLIQALYFVIIDTAPGPRGESADRDPRQTVRSRVQALLREQKLERAFEELQLSARRSSDT
jgi:hypothetical protein